jgi:hypothetical protein
MSKCLVEGCDGRIEAKGLCGKHYMRKRRTGDVGTVRPPGRAGSARKHFMYGAWGGMVNRCHNPNNSAYGRYGAVGIYVCDRWRHGEEGATGFECFLADMGERPEGMTLDRIDPQGPYSPGNCAWATLQHQRSNQSERGRRAAITKGSASKRSVEYSDFGAAIYKRIIAKGLSVNAAARQMGRGPSFLFAVLRGEKKPSKTLLGALEAHGFTGHPVR